MGMPQEITNATRAEEPAAVPANENALKVITLPAAEEAVTIFESGLADLKALNGLRTTSPDDMDTAIDALQRKAAGLRKQLAGTAVEAFKRADEKVEVAEAPALILRKSGDYKPGEWVKEKNGAFVKTFTFDEYFGGRYPHADFKINQFDSFEDLGTKTFDNMAKKIASSVIGGRNGLKLNPACYEPDLAGQLVKLSKELKEGGKPSVETGNFIATLEGVFAIYNARNEGEYKRRAEENLPGKLVTVASGTDGAHWQWSCTPTRNDPGNVRAVDFTDGNGGWNYRGTNRLSGRVSFAELTL